MQQQATEKPKIEPLNGVDLSRLFDTIEAIKGTPGIAKFKFRARNEWINGGHNRTTIMDFFGAQQNHSHREDFVLDEDEHQVLLGEDNGPNPVEYLLAGLVGCLTSSLAYHAAARNIAIRAVESRLEGDLDLRGFLGLSEDVPVGYESIRVYFKIDADISEAQKEELIKIAQKYSPVFNSIVNPTPVNVFLEK